ncbi:MAG: PQQ-dependent sugar dehydrogenase [Deltaproteobacteria bacterium]|nr:PQQ-dependent sugar dehydrogenase [Deltaproteobacteria bacterium]MDQ3297747.1 PQQ-dependent sugar dehydrogenase [Myxococcota bacterium]
MQPRLVTLFVLLAGCRGDGRSPDHAQRHVPEGPGSATVAQPADSPGGSAAEPGSAAPPVATPTGTPPGSAKLVPVPTELGSKVALREVIRGLDRPVLLTVAPGDTRRRLFIVEQHVGRIRILENGKLLPSPFLTIDGISKGNEQGLLGLAFHPRFAENRKLYINYTARDKDTHIVEYQVSAQNPDTVDPATRREIIEIDQPYSNHNGGHVLFGPDGKLYTGMGDGGSAGDPLRAGQNPKLLLGKILRFDVDAAKPVPEISHLGARNPWRFWFDAKTGALYIGDVGQNLWESVFVVSGTDGVKHNFGWNVTEGNHCFEAKTCDRTAFTPAVADYPHDQGCSITGGVTYRGKALPMLDGRYFYADFCTGLLRSFVWTHDPSSPTAAGWVREHHDWKKTLDREGDVSQISSFGVDHDGEVYVVTLTGAIYQLVPR